MRHPGRGFLVIFGFMSTPYVIGIAGGSGSGKTSVTRKIMTALGEDLVLVLQHDWYYRDLSSHGGMKPDDINFDHPDALESELLVSHLRDLRNGKSVDAPQYDFSTHSRRGSRTLVSRPVILLDGILILAHEGLRRELDLKVFVDTAPDERLLRRIRRDLAERGRSLDSVVHQYETTVRPMHEQFVEPSKVWADIIIPRGGENAVAIDLVIQKIRGLLTSR